MNVERLLLVELDVAVRATLADYLRECGYHVMEAFNDSEARQLVEAGPEPIHYALIAVDIEGGNGFALASWVRGQSAETEILLAGTVEKTAEQAKHLCAEGPAITKPYDHEAIFRHLKHLASVRDKKGQ